MARKRRQRPESDRIEIERNIIERSLMQAKSFVRNNRKLVLNSFLGLLVLAVVIIAALFIIDTIENRDQKRFEKIMREYAEYSSTGNRENMKRVVRDLEQFIDTSYFGFPHAMGYYVLGNIYFDEKDYKKARQLLRRYADRHASSLLAAIALLKAAIACEEMNDLKSALGIYRRLEDDYADSVIADQIYFNFARVSGKTNDMVNARRYYNKIVSSFPDSSFAAAARARLFMLGAR
ncbi:MAG: hypothetical protein A2W19_09205 [Spirochaetes bacterium RBG_16_49_21]|nr:MAG: hypothetical protein A2W19_09205 [Spirochaetes bacterium RBG_16_49_21]